MPLAFITAKSVMKSSQPAYGTRINSLPQTFPASNFTAIRQIEEPLRVTFLDKQLADEQKK